MCRVVTVENGQSKHKEIILVLVDHQDTSAAILVDVPNVVVGVDLDPLSINQETKGTKSTCHETVYESDTLLGEVLRFVRGQNEFFQKPVELALWHCDVRTTRVKNGVKSPTIRVN